MASGIHINPANRGKYTARAKAHGRTVQQQAAADLRPGSGASAKEKKRAVFANNARKWNHRGSKRGKRR